MKLRGARLCVVHVCAQRVCLARCSQLQWQSDHGMPVDPHEPKYCYCNKVSYGNMVACDNDHVRLALCRVRSQGARIRF